MSGLLCFLLEVRGCGLVPRFWFWFRRRPAATTRGRRGGKSLGAVVRPWARSRGRLAIRTPRTSTLGRARPCPAARPAREPEADRTRRRLDRRGDAGRLWQPRTARLPTSSKDEVFEGAFVPNPNTYFEKEKPPPRSGAGRAGSRQSRGSARPRCRWARTPGVARGRALPRLRATHVKRRAAAEISPRRLRAQRAEREAEGFLFGRFLATGT